MAGKFACIYFLQLCKGARSETEFVWFGALRRIYRHFHEQELVASVLSWQMPPLKKNNARKDYLLATIFDECQRTSSAHKKRIKSLNEVRLKHADSFDKEFFLHIDRILLIWKKEPSVERLCNFITSFVTSNEEGVQGLAMALVKYLLDVADVKDKAVRFRVCQLISLIMTNLNEDAEIECVPRASNPSQ